MLPHSAALRAADRRTSSQASALAAVCRTRYSVRQRLFLVHREPRRALLQRALYCGCLSVCRSPDSTRGLRPRRVRFARTRSHTHIRTSAASRIAQANPRGHLSEQQGAPGPLSRPGTTASPPARRPRQANAPDQQPASQLREIEGRCSLRTSRLAASAASTPLGRGADTRGPPGNRTGASGTVVRSGHRVHSRSGFKGATVWPRRRLRRRGNLLPPPGQPTARTGTQAGRHPQPRGTPRSSPAQIRPARPHQPDAAQLPRTIPERPRPPRGRG